MGAEPQLLCSMLTRLTARRVAVVALVAAATVFGPGLSAQAPSSDRSDLVKVMDRVLVHRADFLRDSEAKVSYCDAWRETLAPENLTELLRWEEGILEVRSRDAPPCGSVSDLPPAPFVQIREISVTADGATAELFVRGGSGNFLESYGLRRSPNGVFSIERVVQHSFSMK